MTSGYFADSGSTKGSLSRWMTKRTRVLRDRCVLPRLANHAMRPFPSKEVGPMPLRLCTPRSDPFTNYTSRGGPLCELDRCVCSPTPWCSLSFSFSSRRLLVHLTFPTLCAPAKVSPLPCHPIWWLGSRGFKSISFLLSRIPPWSTFELYLKPALLAGCGGPFP